MNNLLHGPSGKTQSPKHLVVLEFRLAGSEFIAHSGLSLEGSLRLRSRTGVCCLQCPLARIWWRYFGDSKTRGQGALCRSRCRLYHFGVSVGTPNPGKACYPGLLYLEVQSRVGRCTCISL